MKMVFTFGVIKASASEDIKAQASASASEAIKELASKKIFISAFI
jgi:hypothetical protein